MALKTASDFVDRHWLKRRQLWSLVGSDSKCNDCVNRKFIVYADDILLIAKSVSELRNLSRACEKELITIDMKINVKKSCCMWVGSRCNANCANLQTSDGQYLPWVSEMRYLGIFVVKSRSFRCSFSHSKRSFFGAVNGVFGKLLNLASVLVINSRTS